jgi:hypothetical protein
MKAVLENKVFIYSNVNELAKKIISFKMKEEGCKTFTQYMVGWVDCMDEIESQSNEDFVPYTIDSVLPIAIGALDNEIGVLEGNTLYLGKSPNGFAQAIETVIKDGLKLEK